jgi:hypothetical protein
VAPECLDDAALIAAIPDAGLADCHALAAEAGRRRLVPAIPALEALCRRFRGFGLHHPVPEQVAALSALAAVGGRDAASAVSQIIVDGVVQGPGPASAVGSAAKLKASLPAETMLVLLRHAEPAIRADACRCAHPQPRVITVLADLLDDLNAAVASAAACALGNMGRIEARPRLLHLLRENPTETVIAASVGIADTDVIVQLGRIARTRPDLAARHRGGHHCTQRYRRPSDHSDRRGSPRGAAATPVKSAEASIYRQPPDTPYATHQALTYRQRHRIKIMYGRLKDWRHIAMRYDRSTHTFFSAIILAGAVTF